MLTTWLSGLGAKLAEGWASRAVSPALAFWLGSLALFALGPGGDKRVADAQAAFNSSTVLVQILVLLAAAGLVAVSDQLSTGLSLAVTRLLEGYWPKPAGPLARLFVRRVSGSYGKNRARWTELNEKMDARGAIALSPEEQLLYSRLEIGLHRVPAAEATRMPTRLGNIMRAAETRIAGRYGLDPLLCWPAFWLVIPEDRARTELADARAAVDARTQAWFWAILFCLWTPVVCLWTPISWWWPWPILLVGLAVASIVYYGWLVPAAATYAELVDTVFGLYRAELYKAFGRKMPPDPTDEPSEGASLTAFIWRGMSRSQRASVPSGSHHKARQHGEG